MGDSDALGDLTSDEREALQEVERGLEQFHRAHGALVEFHHAVGRAMDHFEAASDALEDDRPALADSIDGDVLPAGVTADGKLTYRVLAEFEDGILETVEDVADRTVEELADGERYPIERADHDDGPEGP